MKKKILLTSFVITAILVTVFVLYSCQAKTPDGGYSIFQLDLSLANVSGGEYAELYEQYVIDDASDYMAHPDSVAVDRDGDGVKETLITMYPEGHGKGAVLTKESTDGGKTWSERRIDTPTSWKYSKETPTIYDLDGEGKRLVMISAVPSWGAGHGDGFNASYSSDAGKTWSEFKNYWGWGTDGYVDAIVAMASLTRLKDENGNWADAWMGLYHDYSFYNYKTILTFDENGEMVWSKPVKYFVDYRNIEKKAAMCEVEVIRSDNGLGNELMLLARSNSKKMRGLISYSTDEGVTWSEPREVLPSLNGERYKADYLDDGRLAVTFRSIEFDKDIYKQLPDAFKREGWYSEGWIAWIGTYSDIKSMYNGDKSAEGQYRIKLAHTYLDGQTFIQRSANADTGYCGNVVLDDGTFFTSSYGKFGAKNQKGEFKTYIVGKRLDFNKVDKLVASAKGNY